ncbi:unnamed protein product [Durusdinium trenchii]|uniref:Protein C10 n=2 Tax=Durusdinium trenchii TaxID=1381693 RepID=A0ABP0Q2X0_9DINO
MFGLVQLPSRRKLASELDESTWKGQWGYPLPNDQTNALDKHRDMLGAILEEQERLIQARHLDHREVNEKYVSKGSQSYVAANPDAGAKDTNLMDENAAKMRPSWAVDGTEPKDATAGVPLERTFDLTLTLTGDFVDELARGYSQPWFQELLKLCSEECGEDRERFICRLQDIAFEVQRPILENWGFEGNEQGLFDMTSILREHSRTAPNWLQEKIDRCLLLSLDIKFQTFSSRLDARHPANEEIQHLHAIVVMLY